MKSNGIQQQRLSQFAYSHGIEWLETNGLGGWAASTVSGAHSRRQHGMLVASPRPRANPLMLVSKLEESIAVDGKRFDLSCNQYPHALYPEGHQHLREFRRDLFPTFTYWMDNIGIRKIIASIYRENTVVILYEVIDAPHPFTFELRPMYSARDVHQLSRANDSINRQFIFSNGILRVKNYASTPEIFMGVPASSFREDQHWYYSLTYRAEQGRGMDYREDIYSHGVFSVTLQKGSRLGIILSTHDPHRRSALKLLRKEEKRRRRLIAEADTDRLKQLILAADQFVISHDDGTVMAAYPGSGEKSRDTLMAISGLCLATGRVKEARSILHRLGGHVRNGLIPDEVSDPHKKARFQSIDVSLWYFVAVYHYYMFTRDARFVRSLLPKLTEIIDQHVKGTLHGIRMDDDGMLASAETRAALTWMDAVHDDGPVTRRPGKAVEVNALWYNALRIMEFLTIEAGRRKHRGAYGVMATKLMENFMKVFWNENGGYLFDYVNGDYRSPDIRPNQLYPITLPFPLLPRNRAERVLHVVERELMTPKGLRSLSPSAPGYKPVYEGGPWARDEAAHQGTVWGHLLGVYIDAVILLRGDKGKNDARDLLESFLSHLGEECVGTLSELFDGAPPHAPGGSFAHAATVGEILRVATEHGLLHKRHEQAVLTGIPMPFKI